MPNPINSSLNQILFVIKEGAHLRKFQLGDEYQSAKIASMDQLLACADRALLQKMKMIVILSEEEYEAANQLLRIKTELFQNPATGFVVIAKDVREYLKRATLNPELLDVYHEKEIRTAYDFHLHRAVRQLQQLGGVKKSKISAEMLAKLNQFFIVLSAERVPEKLYEKILVKAVELVDCTGGSLYIVQDIDGENHFRYRVSLEVGKEISSENKIVTVAENSLCGYVALTGKTNNISDLNTLNSFSSVQWHELYDHPNRKNYDSVITLALKNSRNEVEAVLQLVGKKPSDGAAAALSFDAEDEAVLNAYTTQAGVCLENVDLYTDVQGLFEGFVRASVKAIESRDPSTGGHSERVAQMCVGLARAITECEVGTYRSVRFRDEEIRELEYAAMLHDFGKIGVREEVLVKAKKLHSWQLEGIRERIKICKAAAKINYLEKRLASGLSSDAKAHQDYQLRLKEIDHYWEVVQASNSPSIMKQESVAALERIRSEQLLLPDGDYIALLSEEEYKALAVTRGTLTEGERLEIESHVRHTYQFLKMIPWTRDFKKLTEIAYCHHEKLDGSGYPRALTSHEIPLQSKIMTIADIFDALTAKDRWYKDSVPIEKALEILAIEVNEGKLDEALFELFVAKKIFEVTQPKLIHQVA